MKAQPRTADAEEIRRFSEMSEKWWDEHGPLKPLHDINPVRIGWILEQVTRALCLVPREENKAQGTRHKPLEGVRLLDIGCGGGLVSEPMARLGAHVTAIDASEKNIAVAKLHAEQSGLEIDYRCITAEELLSSLRAEGEAIQPRRMAVQEDLLSADAALTGLLRRSAPRNDGFDVVLALEIVEHVADVPLFIDTIAKLVKPGGLIIMSTLNRTPKSFALGIVAAEYILRWIPRGTHSWDKFLKPHELAAHLRRNNMEILEMTGLRLNPLNWKWELTKDLGVNYLLAATSPPSSPLHAGI